MQSASINETACNHLAVKGSQLADAVLFWVCCHRGRLQLRIVTEQYTTNKQQLSQHYVTMGHFIFRFNLSFKLKFLNLNFKPNRNLNA